MKRRKIYYVPGMISLIFLPILCVWYLNEHKNVERCFEVSYAQEYNKEAENHRFDTSMLSLPEYKRQYIEVFISNSNVKNKSAFAIVQRKLNQILKNKDKHSGIHIIFSDNSKYESYIKAIDIIENSFKKHSAFHTYCPYTNNIWVLYIKSNNQVKNNIPNGNYEQNKKSEIQLTKDKLVPYSFLAILYLTLITVSIYYIKNNYIKT